jgi:peptide chain release factor 2
MQATKKEFELFQNIIESILADYNLEEIQKTKSEIESKMSQEEVWSDPKLSKECNQKLTIVNQKLQEYKVLNDNYENLKIAFELDDDENYNITKTLLDNSITQIQLSKFMSGPFDSSNVLLSVTSGAGGVDAMDWASMIVSMYQAFCSLKNWNCQLVSLSSSPEGGTKSATLEISAKSSDQNIFGMLKVESGVHRLVRISPFNSGGTRETSFALVEVLPTGLTDQVEIIIDEKDLRIDTFMSSGPGGQGVNTTYSAVRLTHIPTGLVANCQDQRNQLQNKARAIEILKSKIAVIELAKQNEFKNDLKGSTASASWGSQIRNYVLHPYKLVKDTRSGWETSNVGSIIEQGQLDELIWSVIRSSHT